jgi:hypothetical protein
MGFLSQIVFDDLTQEVAGLGRCGIGGRTHALILEQHESGQVVSTDGPDQAFFEGKVLFFD